MEKEFKEYKINSSYLKAIIANNEEEIESISDSISMNSDISDSKLEKIIEYFQENNLKVGFISSFEVEVENRGQGIGKQLIETFKKDIVSKTDVDILLARNNNKQNEGFDLEKFYQKNGFKSVLLESGDLLMATKGYDLVLDNLLNLKEERQKIVEYFEKNEPESDDHEKLLSFVKKIQKERNDLPVIKNRKPKL